MRAIWKNITSPKIGLIEGIFLRRIPPPCHHSGGSESDLKNDNNQEKMVVKLKEGRLWGTMNPEMEWKYADIDMVCRDRSSFDFWKAAATTRWTDLVESELDQWLEKNEKERRGGLEARWTYLRDLLNAVGMDTRNHPQLLSMRYTGRGVQFKIASPETGLTSISNIRLKGGLIHYELPRQTVNGLVCISTGGTFLIYNPVTGEGSDWIKTTVYRRVYSIELGFCPKSNQHKVICILSGRNKKPAASESGEDTDDIEDQQVGAEDQIVEILMVGENTWRRIDAVPPYCVGSSSGEYVERPYYVNGSIYWRFRYTRNGQVVMGFDFETENFRVIPIPKAAVEEIRYEEFALFRVNRVPEAVVEKTKFRQPVQLTEVDGCLAVVEHDETEGDISLWVLIEDTDGSIEWLEEKFEIPHDATWNYKGAASIEVLRGTNLIFVQPENSTSFYYWNRDTKEFVRFPIPPDRHEENFERIMQL